MALQNHELIHQPTFTEIHLLSEYSNIDLVDLKLYTVVTEAASSNDKIRHRSCIGPHPVNKMT
jgi:hypothetical protein